MQKNRTKLKECYLFSLLSEEEKETALLHLAPDMVSCASGDTLFGSTTSSACLYFIESGNLSVYRGDKDGVLLSVLHSGDCVGAASLFAGGAEYPTTVVANGTTILYKMEENKLESLLSIMPKVALAHIQYLSGKIRFLNDKLDSLTGRTSESRLAKYILTYTNDDLIFTPPLSMTKVAASLDISRASLYRLLEGLEKDGIIKNMDGTIHIINKEILERMV